MFAELCSAPAPEASSGGLARTPGKCGPELLTAPAVGGEGPGRSGAQVAAEHLPVSHTLAEAAHGQPGAGRDGLVLWAVEMLSEQHMWERTPGAMRGALRTGTHKSAGGSARGRREQGLISRWLVPRSLHLEQKCASGRAGQGCGGSTSPGRCKVGVSSSGDGEGLLPGWMPRQMPGPKI